MDADANGSSSKLANSSAGSRAELLGEQLVHLVGVRRRHPVEQAAEFPGQLFAEGAGAGRDDLPEFDVGRAQVGEGLRESA